MAIKEIVQQALSTGYLTATAQNQIRMLLQTNYDSEDLDALIILQRSLEAGEVKKELPSHKNYRPAAKDANIKVAYQIAAEIASAAAFALSMPRNPHDQPSLWA